MNGGARFLFTKQVFSARCATMNRNLPPAGEEPAFFRIWCVEREGYVKTFRYGPAAMTWFSLTYDFGAAGVFITPSEESLYWLRDCVGLLELRPATFAEWIEARDLVERHPEF